MADNIAVTAATEGTLLQYALDDVGGVLHQRVKVEFGADGSATDVSAANPLPVSLSSPVAVTGAFYQATQPVSGTFWQATQPVSGSVSVSNFPASQAVTGAFYQATQPVSASALPLPAGAATETTLSAINTGISSTVKQKNAAATITDYGQVMLAQRRDADTAETTGDGQYTALKQDEAGRLKVATQPGSYPTSSSNITASAQTAFLDVRRVSNVMIHVVAASLVGHNSTFEGSLDSTNGTDGNWFAIQVVRSNANTIELVTGVLAATPAYAWEASVNGLAFVRVRATAHTSGTATWKFLPGTYATEPIPAAQASATQAVSGTVTATVTGGTVIGVTPTTTNAILSSAATTNGTIAKASAGTIYAVVASNTGAAVAFVKLHNSATITAGTTAVALTIPVPAGGVLQIDFGSQGMRYSAGICYSITNLAADNDTTAVALAQVKVNLAYI